MPDSRSSSASSSHDGERLRKSSSSSDDERPDSGAETGNEVEALSEKQVEEILDEITAQYDAQFRIVRDENLRNYIKQGELEETSARSQAKLKQCQNAVRSLQIRIMTAVDRITDFNITLQRLLKESELENWIDERDMKYSEVEEEIEVQRKEQMAQGAEIEKLLAEAAQRSTDVASLVVEMSERVSKSQESLIEARHQAEEARRKYEAGRKAGGTGEPGEDVQEEPEGASEEELKRRMEEEMEMRREEERMFLKMQEEKEMQRKREEAENRERERKEREALQREEENKKMMAEDPEAKRKREEEEKKEKERRDVRNWPRLEYEVRGSEFDDGPICIVRAMESDNLSKSDLLVQLKNPLSGVPPMNCIDDMVSDILTIEPASIESDFKMDEPWAIALRHCAQRNPAREPIIMGLTQDDTWHRMHSQEVHFEELHGQKFIETRIKEPFCCLVVVSTVKTDRYQVGKKGNKTNSSVDSRIAMTWPPAALRVTLDLIMQVQPVESHILSELKGKHKDMFSNLNSSSHIVNMSIVKKRTLKPITISFPVPFNSAKKPRPLTAPEKSKQESAGARPMTAFHGSESTHDEDEELHIVAKVGSATKWKEFNVEPMQQKNKDTVSFDILMIEPLKFMGMRTKPGVSEESLDKMAKHIEEEFTYRNVCFILRQKLDDQMDVVIQAVPAQKLDKALKTLHDEGFDDEGPLPSKEMMLTERQVLEVRFRGNVRVENHKVPISMMYHSQLRNRLSLYVCEEDKFAQKSIECYRGFAQIFTRRSVHRTVVREEGGVKRNVVEIKEEDVLLCELLINIPKSDTEIFKPLPKAEFSFVANDSVTQGYIRQLSQCVGGEWTQLASELGLSKSRIQAIKRNNAATTNDALVEDMLMTWIKKLPTSVRKARPLVIALERCGRPELAEELRDQEMDYQANRKR